MYYGRYRLIRIYGTAVATRYRYLVSSTVRSAAPQGGTGNRDPAAGRTANRSPYPHYRGGPLPKSLVYEPDGG